MVTTSAIIAWLGTVVVNIVIASITSTFVCLLLMRSVLGRISTVENSVSIARGIEGEMKGFRADLVRHEADDDKKFDAIQKTCAEIVNSNGKIGEAVDWIKETIKKGEARIGEHDVRNRKHLDALKKEVSELGKGLAVLQSNDQPKKTARRKRC